ncbi:orphan sodium- and chloride-dependent neurotransmitter transporter NTT5 [Sceloporus undulatus]|uniref:orphan sodium- and chloride-dependent neurotransmitter transporter NTT5 n=1 Tax=Sceloporus undulatus TaxID=8520 RepID=UPI001C4DCA25|nr:orphan sodium- and chloride-dependent neurotransmitter transporter NTT5 [Sceloporus undulatus]
MEKSKADLESVATPEDESNQDLLSEESAARPAWGSKAQYILAQVGFSVGLGNVWRFPYLCHQNGGGAFLLLYLLLLFVIGIPLFFLELAAGQIIRQGSIGVWKYISPRLVGIGFASCVVCSFVALYYNVIIAWSLFYLANSFQFPLPWNDCPETVNQTVPETECLESSATVYFWYRKALHVTNSIEESGGLDPALTGCLFAAWVLVGLAMIKGIKSSGKVLYFSSLFPYVVLFCFLIRALLLEGAADGIWIMFTPKLSIWGDMQVWRQAATQVFFALGLGFGTIIAYSSYNPRHNNCHFDGLLVALVNFLTSVLATLVVFAVLGFRANIIAQKCAERNTEVLAQLALNGSLSVVLPENFTYYSASQYSAWYQELQNNTEQQLLLQKWEIGDCRAEDEMHKGVEGTGLAFIAFTEAMTLFPTAPFWSVLFFFMLLNLGLSTMLGNMQGIITPLLDNFHSLQRRRTLFTVLCCIVGFLFGLVFVQRSGNYFVTMFDDYSATLPLLIVVAFEAFAVAWIYGADRFLGDIEKMLGWRPWRIYKYMWRFVSLASMLCLLIASLVRMILKRPTYRSWNREKAEEQQLEYPPWAMGVLFSLIVVAALPIPVMFLRQLVIEWFSRRSRRSGLAVERVPTEEEYEAEEKESPADPDHKGNGYVLVQAEDRQD